MYLERFLERFLTYLSRHPAPLQILDCGCGPGRDALYFTARGCSVSAVDLADRMLHMARRRGRGTKGWQHIDLLCGDMQHLPFQGEVFHGVWCCASLLFVPRAAWSSVLSAFHRILKPHGILYLAVKTLWNPSHLLQSIRSKLLHRTYPFGEVLLPHRIYFTFARPRTIRTLLHQTGFQLLGSQVGLTWINLWAQKGK